VLQTTKGIGEEVILKLLEMDGVGHSPYPCASTHADVKGDMSYAYAIDTEKFKYVTLKMIRGAGVHILFHTYFSDVILDKDTVTGIIIENKSGRQAVFGKVIIDASGDGDVAYRAGVPFWQTVHDENPRLNDGLMYKISGFTGNEEHFGCEYKDTSVVWGPGLGAGNGADAEELTEEEIQARLSVYHDFEEKKKSNPALKNAEIIDTGVLLGIRQTRFIEGEYKLTAEDVIDGKSFEDSIAMAANPIIHYYGYRRFLNHTGYEIPYRCLLPKKVDGLLVAGRCMSSDQQAYESWRAMAHIMAIGEGAGTAAALAVKYKIQPRQINVKELREQLITQGAEVGQGKS
jgi:hypothetical protein